MGKLGAVLSCNNLDLSKEDFMYTLPFMTLEEILQIASERTPKVDEVNECCVLMGVTVKELCDKLSRHVAIAYANRNLDFQFCDGVMNNLMAFVVTNQHGWLPDFSFEVFLAFDSGEFYPDAVRDVSPEDRFTRPMIVKLLDQHP